MQKKNRFGQIWWVLRTPYEWKWAIVQRFSSDERKWIFKCVRFRRTYRSKHWLDPIDSREERVDWESRLRAMQICSSDGISRCAAFLACVFDKQGLHKACYRHHAETISNHFQWFGITSNYRSIATDPIMCIVGATNNTKPKYEIWSSPMWTKTYKSMLDSECILVFTGGSQVVLLLFNCTSTLMRWSCRWRNCAIHYDDIQLGDSRTLFHVIFFHRDSLIQFAWAEMLYKIIILIKKE